MHWNIPLENIKVMAHSRAMFVHDLGIRPSTGDDGWELGGMDGYELC
jgi:hypothetical protein